MTKTMNKSQYQQIQTLIEENAMISGFDLYYLGFFSHFVPQLTLSEIFAHVGNVISLHNDQLITSEEKIEFLIRMLSKKIDLALIKDLAPHSTDGDRQTSKFLNNYFSQILKILPKYTSINKFELFYLGRFHAICPAYKIAELFHHINNINQLVTEDLIDEETQVDFLLRILNKKILATNTTETVLDIPQESLSPFRGQERQDENQVSTAYTTQERLSLTESDRRFVVHKPQPGQNQTSKNEKPKEMAMSTEVERAPTLRDEFKDNDIKGNKKRDMEVSEHEGSEEIDDEDRGDANSESVGVWNEDRRGGISNRNYTGDSRLQSRQLSKQFSFQNSVASGEASSLRKAKRFSSEGTNHAKNSEEFEDEDKDRDLNKKKTGEQEVESSSEEEEVNKLRKGKSMEDEVQEDENEEDEEENINEREEKSRSPSVPEYSQNTNYMKNNEVMIVVGDPEERKTEEDQYEERESMEQEEVGTTNNKEMRDVDGENAVRDDSRENMEVIEKQKERIHKNPFEDSQEASITQERQGLAQASQESMEIESKQDKKNQSGMQIDQENQARTEGQLPVIQSSLSKEQDRVSESDNTTERNILMAQMYPEEPKGKTKNTLDDVLNSIFESDDARSEASQRSQRVNNHLPSSLGSIKGSSLPKDKAAEQPIDLSLAAEQNHELSFAVPNRKDQKPFEASPEGIEEGKNSPMFLGDLQASKKAPHQENVLEENRDIENTPESLINDKATQEDVTSQSEFESSQNTGNEFSKPSPQKSRVAEIQRTQKDKALTLNWRANRDLAQNDLTGFANHYKEILLQQVVNHIQPVLLEDPIIPKREESEVRLLEANTQADPTQEEGQDNASAAMSRSPNDPTDKEHQHIDVDDQIDSSVRLCSTVKQTLSQPNRENVSECMPEDIQEREVVVNQGLSQNEVSFQGSQSKKDNLAEFDGTQYTIPEKILSTLEEERLARQTLLALQKDREMAGNQTKEDRGMRLEERKSDVPRFTENTIETKSRKMPEEPKKDVIKGQNKNIEVSVDKNSNNEKPKTNKEKPSKKGESSPINVEEIVPINNNAIAQNKSLAPENRTIEEEKKRVNSVVEKPIKNKRSDVEENKNNDALIVQKVQSSIPVLDLNKCSLCKNDLALKLEATIEICGHRFHQDCLRDFLSHKIDEKIIPIKCPRTECKSFLRLVDLMDVIDDERQERYVETLLQPYIEAHDDIACCPTPGCPFAFLKAYHPNRFKCTLCKKTYCMTCRVEWHLSIACNDYQASHKLEEGEENNYLGAKFKQCPECKSCVSKKYGSNKMECRCKTSFCYSCGKVQADMDCPCINEETSQQRPIVQPDLFHRAMQSPLEYKTPQVSRTEGVNQANSLEANK